jgi:MFS family permease
MPMVYSVGSIIGPMIGGTFSNPLHRKAGESAAKSNALLWKFPYLLPNLISASIFLIGIIIGILFLNESLESRKDQRDWGIILGRKLIYSSRMVTARLKQIIWGQPLYTPLATSDHPRSKGIKDIEQTGTAPKPIEGPPSFASVLNSQTVLYLAVYTALAMHNTGFDQMLSVLMHHPRSGPLVGKTELPFKFSRGFGMGKFLIMAHDDHH